MRQTTPRHPLGDIAPKLAGYSKAGVNSTSRVHRKQHGQGHPTTHTEEHSCRTPSQPRANERASTRRYTPTRRVSTETKASFKTTELIAYVAAVIGVLAAAQISDDFGAQDAWFYVSLLTIGYMISRGLAKSGSRDFYDDDANRNAHSRS